MQKLACPNCATEIPSGNINIAQTLAVCPNCDTVFDFGFMAEEKDKPKSKTRRKMRPPKGFTILEDGGGFVMSWRWFQPIAIFLTFFVIAWDAFLIFWYRMALGFGGVSDCACRCWRGADVSCAGAVSQPHCRNCQE